MYLAKFCTIFLDLPLVVVGPENPYRVELDHTAEMKCVVDARPRYTSNMVLKGTVSREFR